MTDSLDHNPGTEATVKTGREKLAELAPDPVELSVDAETNARVEVDLGQDDAEGMDINVNAGRDSTVKIKIDDSGQEDAKRNVAMKTPALMRWIMRPYVTLVLLLMPVLFVALFLIYDMPPTVLILMIAVSVAGWFLLMASLYHWATLYYHDICESYGKEKGIEIVSNIAGGLSEAFPAAIVALGIGGAAAYYQYSTSQNEIVLQDRQWHHEHTRSLLEDLTSYGYGSLAIITTAKERIIWINNYDAYMTENEIIVKEDENPPFTYITDGLDRQQTYAKYEELIKEYSASKSLDSILSGVKAHFSVPYDHQSENQILIAMEITVQATQVADNLKKIEGYSRWGKAPLDPNDNSQWSDLLAFSRSCGKGIAQLQELIQYYIIDSTQWKKDVVS